MWTHTCVHIGVYIVTDDTIKDIQEKHVQVSVGNEDLYDTEAWRCQVSLACTLNKGCVQ